MNYFRARNLFQWLSGQIEFGLENRGTKNIIKEN